MIKALLKKLSNYFRRSTPQDTTSPINVSYEFVDSYESLVSAFKITSGKYKDVVFSIVKVTPRESLQQDALHVNYIYDILQSPVPAEHLEVDPEFCRTVEQIVAEILSNPEGMYEATLTNNPWLTNIE